MSLDTLPREITDLILIRLSPRHVYAQISLGCRRLQFLSQHLLDFGGRENHIPLSLHLIIKHMTGRRRASTLEDAMWSSKVMLLDNFETVEGKGWLAGSVTVQMQGHAF
ncbi:hypothetical protein M427DRAFT_55415 [Gonapodya prolifera JEL478]|uniref:F-box domain-containing protein n=1 Tax=Gonapodya prolifera (strain JEL478) TaxID=1344416 RepID=A0A139AI33_GONPJ|nr:hypothetical protein M427DRAFT_55415 [Gonapodya prolifera JEL478]|eukprot:KXS16457.1 hypothetical protein M427DRAFT_55415 [Gonapodya prolifera JEL478]